MKKQPLFIIILLVLTISMGQISFSQKNTVTLHIAVQQNDINKVRELVENGSSVNTHDRLGNTCLTIAAYNGHLDVLKLLIEYGANVNGTDNRGNTPLMLVVLKGHFDIAKYLIEQGANYDEKSKDGKTPLMLAIMNDNSEENMNVITYLVSQGVDLNLTDNHGRTAFDYAQKQEARDFLISMGAKGSVQLK